MNLTKKLFYTFIKILVLYLFAGLIFIVYALNNKLDNYDIKNDYYDGNIEISYNENSDSFKSDKNNNSVQNYIDCYEYPIKEEEFTVEMKNKLNEIYNLFSDPNYTLSFAYEDLYTGLHISYNENQLYFSASTIKAPVALYIYQQAELGKIDLESYMTYTPEFYVEGSGSIQYQPMGSTYKIKELTRKTIVESDNIAYQMISSKADNNIKNFWKDKGADSFWSYSVWGNTNAHDSIIYLKEIYNYQLTNTDLSNELMSYYYNSVFPLIKSNDGAKVAHKSGWHYEIMHDTAIIFDEYPYALAIMTNKGYSDYDYFFSTASKLINEFHDLYWENKSNYCYNKHFMNENKK